uniref:Peptidase A1 domain-containing protein n=2 Tax=Bos TaxID=9903 RepID=A0A4W2HA49_BOBOX
MNVIVTACKHGCQALVDTRTLSLCGSRSMVTNIHSLIGASLFQDDKDHPPIMTLLTLTFTINGIDYPVPTQAYIQKVRVIAWPRHRVEASCQPPVGAQSRLMGQRRL